MKLILVAFVLLVSVSLKAEDPLRPDSKLISLELGGSNDPKNLWPESYYTEPFNAHVKDKLEDRMAANVRKELAKHGHAAATVVLKQYQREIATDWIAAYHKYVSAMP
jgi:hypothetical protein